MTDPDKLRELAALLEACAEDAKRDEPVRFDANGYADIVKLQPPAVISLANGLLAIAASLRTIARESSDAD